VQIQDMEGEKDEALNNAGAARNSHGLNGAIIPYFFQLTKGGTPLEIVTVTCGPKRHLTVRESSAAKHSYRALND